MKFIKGESMNLKVVVDKRTELLGCLLLISDYAKNYSNLIQECNNAEYRNNVFNHFNKFKKEKAVLLLNKIINELNFCYDAPIRLFLQLNEDFTYGDLPDYPFKDRLNSSNLVLEFLDELPHFISKSKFEQFYKSNAKFYNLIIEETKIAIDVDSIINFLNELYKFDLSRNKYVINLLPFTSNSNFAYCQEKEMWCNLGCKNYGLNKITFAIEGGDVSLIPHEFSHSLVNPLVFKYITHLPKNYFNSIKKQMSALGYTDNITILDETIIRAIEYVYIKYFSKVTNKQKQLNFFIDYFKNNGFIYLDIMVPLIEDYYTNIKKYRDFEEYFPILVKNFKAQKTLYDKNSKPLNF